MARGNGNGNASQTATETTTTDNVVVDPRLGGHDPKAPWATEDTTSYDPREFYVGSTDGHGHGDTHYVKVPPHISAQIKALVEGHYFPKIRARDDFWRDAAVHDLERIRHLVRDPDARKTIDELLSTLLLDDKLARLQVELKAVEEQSQKLEATIEMLIAVGDFLRAKTTVYENIDVVTEEWHEPYRTTRLNLLTRLEARIDKAEGIS